MTATLPFGPPGVFLNLVSSGIEDTQNIALFGEAEWRATDRLSLVMGIRYDSETLDEASETVGTFDPPIAPPIMGDPELTDTDYDAFLPKAQIIYSWTDALSTSFTYQRGYRAGGVEFSVLTSESLDFDAEFTNNYELALRSLWLDGRLTANFNVFFLEWTDQQVRIPLVEAFPELADLIPPGANPDDFLATVNAGESEIYGAEVELNYDVGDALNFFLSVGYSKTEFIDFPVGGGGNFAGNEFANAPNWSAAVGVNYTHSSGAFLNTNVSYSDGQFSNNNNADDRFSDSYVLVNTRFGYRWDNITVAFFANNLFDEEYTITVNEAANIGNGGTDRVIGGQVLVSF